MHIMLFLRYSLVGIGDVIITTMLLFVITCYHYVFEITYCYHCYDWVIECNLLQVNLPIVLALRIVASETGLEDLPRDLEKHLAAASIGLVIFEGYPNPISDLICQIPQAMQFFP